jgi:regulator of CtrA degradation
MIGLAPKTTFFSKTYDETMDLLVEARNYVATDGLRRRPRLAPADQLLLCCETFRLTARLTHVMAWLLAQRAVHEGEISREDAATEMFALGGRTTCLMDNADVVILADDWLITLLERSLKLYVRIARLDDLVRRDRLPRRTEYRPMN